MHHVASPLEKQDSPSLMHLLSLRPSKFPALKLNIRKVMDGEMYSSQIECCMTSTAFRIHKLIAIDWFLRKNCAYSYCELPHYSSSCSCSHPPPEVHPTWSLPSCLQDALPNLLLKLCRRLSRLRNTSKINNCQPPHSPRASRSGCRFRIQLQRLYRER